MEKQSRFPWAAVGRESEAGWARGPEAARWLWLCVASGGQQAGPSCAVSRWDQRINVTVLAVTMWVVTSGGNSGKDAWDVAVCSFIQIHVNLQLHLEKKMFN